MSAFLENTVLFGVHGIFGRMLGVEENHGASKTWGAYGSKFRVGHRAQAPLTPSPSPSPSLSPLRAGSCMQHGMSGFVSSTVLLQRLQTAFDVFLFNLNLSQTGTEKLSLLNYLALSSSIGGTHNLTLEPSGPSPGNMPRGGAQSQASGRHVNEQFGRGGGGYCRRRGWEVVLGGGRVVAERGSARIFSGVRGELGARRTLLHRVFQVSFPKI